MNIVQVRSPFKIIIDEPTQLFAQVKLYIWNQGDTEPTMPTYTFSKAVPSIASRECVFNISNQLQEFIEPILAYNQNVVEEEYAKCWCLFKVERFSGTSDNDLSLLDTTNYIGLNGFTNYMDGNQIPEVLDYKSLNQISSVQLLADAQNGYFNLLAKTEATPTNYLTVSYINNEFSFFEYLNVTVYGDDIVLWKIPYINYNLDNYQSPTTITIYYGESLLYTINTYLISECKYTPVKCDFQNSLGGWTSIMFFKAQTNSISVKGSEFNLLPSKTDYNPLRGQSKIFNLNGNQTVKLNTGWVDENYDVLIRDLLLSEIVLLDDKPVMVKTKSMTYKTVLKDKMINYEIDFDYSFDLINNIV